MTRLLSDIIPKSATRAADQDAFRCRSESISYGELRRRTSHLAAELQKAGLQPSDRVAIFMPKCIEMPIAVHGCLQAGVVYVPIDPALPPERLRSVLTDADVSAVLTVDRQSRLLNSVLPELPRTPAIIIGIKTKESAKCISDWAAIDGSQSHIAVCLEESDPAYIIYTSGSTGQPKGIVHTHGSGMAYARLSSETYDVRPSDRLANFAPLHFDQSTFEFLSGPLAGATTVMIPEEHMRFPASLSKLIEDEQITIWYSVPFALTQMLQRGALEQRNMESLRWVLYGGEPFPVGQLRQLMHQWPHTTFSNIYGPAEVNQCTVFNLTEPPDEGAASIPLGKAWRETTALIVDDNGHEVSSSEIGELWISSSTAMKEYWNRPNATAASFASRKVHHEDLRFFRTGDLVSADKEGNLHFHGRQDRQVKIRGHRVELDAIESVILKLSAVHSVGAFAVTDAEEEQRRIVAAVIPAKGATLSDSDVLRIAEAELPRYAVPSEVIVTDQFPQTTSQKTDYIALANGYITTVAEMMS